MGKSSAKLKAVVPASLKLDIGCGKNKKPGFHGVDAIKFDGVDTVHDMRQKWPWADGSVIEVHCSHFLEHLSGVERYTFFNELYRVLQKDAKALIITPYWRSGRAYGDPTHQWPPVCEMSFYYLDKGWRAINAPHTDIAHNPQGFNCDFHAVGGYGLHQALLTRSPEYQNFAINWYCEAAQDMHTTLTKR